MVWHAVFLDEGAPGDADIATFLAENGYSVRTVRHRTACRAAVAASDAHLAILRCSAFDADVLSLVRDLVARYADLDILVLTADAAPPDKVQCLDAGACDHLREPVELREFKARLRLLERRRNRAARYLFLDWTLDSHARLVLDPNGVSAELTRGEFEVMRLLVHANGEAVPRSMLSDAASRGEESEARTADTLISRLRKKLDADARGLIVTVIGVGYRIGTPVRANFQND